MRYYAQLERSGHGAPGAIGWYGMHACLYISADASVLSARSTHARLARSVCAWLLNYQVSTGDLLKRR